MTNDDPGLGELVREVEAAARPVYGLDSVDAARVLVVCTPQRDGTEMYCASFGFDPLCSLLVGTGPTAVAALEHLLREVRESHRALLGVATRDQVIATIQALARRYEAGLPLER